MTDNTDTYKIILRKSWQNRTLLVIDEAGYRSLYFDNHLTQSRILLEQPLWLILPYTRHMLASLLFNPKPQQILMVGLGGGSLAKFFLHHYPTCQIDAVDANPEIPAIAEHLFFLPDDPRLTLHCADGASLLTSLSAQKRLFDLIFIDAFDHDGMAPSIYSENLLSTIEQLLSKNGVVAFNINRAETALYQQMNIQIPNHFPENIYRLPVPSPSRNEIFLCSRTAMNANSIAQLQEQAHSWSDHQPPLLFHDFLERLTPVPPTTKQQWWQPLLHLWHNGLSR
ncbi:MnmC family methyltransferase [Candidatus Magnetaquicoccus inordinatus]|uniref:spermine/spermidine synthase domain-containing protein n=1 Tax=Candidatus Magnetaquicoccus inordinatus TaxID=2496818 RepID=UPI00187D56AC|nr:MnmC family methyltransferase [Candidatus Magnetaquicoccus inordinatus]